MFKLKNQTFLLTNYEKLRFLSASTATALANTITNPYFDQQLSINLNTQIQQIPEPHFSQPLDTKFYISVLLNCRTIFQIRQVHAQVTLNGMLQNLVVANKLLYIYAQHKALGDAYALFGWMRERDPVTWSVMVSGFAKVGDYMNCFGTFREVIRCGVRPDNYTLPIVIRACRDRMDVQMGRMIHEVGLKFGLELDHVVCAALVDMYAKCRAIEDARQLFDKL